MIRFTRLKFRDNAIVEFSNCSGDVLFRSEGGLVHEGMCFGQISINVAPKRDHLIWAYEAAPT